MQDFLSSDNLYLIPPYLESQRDFFISSWKDLNLEDHVFLFSSGTTNTQKLKFYVISKQAIINNAKAVNEFLNCDPNDSWLASLPAYHIGGLSIFIRSYLAKTKLVEIDQKWQPQEYYKLIQDHKISYFSLIPRQLYEFVQLNVKAPSALKGVFIGGDFLPDSLAQKALALDWPIIKTYGMTELSSQIATSFYADTEEGFLCLLPIHKIHQGYITSNALFSGMGEFKQNGLSFEPFVKSSYKLPDEFELKEVAGKQFLKPLGRRGDEFKLKGRLINLQELKNLLAPVFIELGCYSQIELVPSTDALIGSYLNVYMEQELKNIEEQMVHQMLQLAPYLKDVLKFTYFDKLPKTSIGKIKRM